VMAGGTDDDRRHPKRAPLNRGCTLGGVGRRARSLWSRPRATSHTVWHPAGQVARRGTRLRTRGHGGCLVTLRAYTRPNGPTAQDGR
jgi:hypothetical protein